MIGLGGAAYALNHGIFRSQLADWLEERFWELFHEMDTNERSARIMRIIQIDVIIYRLSIYIVRRSIYKLL